jgi:uncharacterized membrane protein YdjX (TVP38/TMEM64 family)
MARYWTFTALLIGFFLLLFGLVEWLEIPLLSDPSPWFKSGGSMAAFVGVGLLVVDVLLPVPSSLVMIAHGALFGIVVGTMLSLLGSVGAAMLGFAIGRRGGSLMDKLVPAHERERANALLQRWGALAIVVTRPIPLLAETVVILAGASPLRWQSTLLAALAGSFPSALLYALAGASAVRFQHVPWMFALVLLVAGVFFVLGRRTGNEIQQQA